jgi:hypothetical protein
MKHRGGIFIRKIKFILYLKTMAGNFDLKSEENSLTRDVKIQNNRILIIFDINGTLLTRIGKNMSIQSDLIDGSICLRPHANKLADFLNENNIDYAFWTTQSEQKAESSFCSLQKFGFTNAKFLWKKDQCTNKYIKDLSVVAREYPMYNTSNIIIVDDSDHKIIDKDRYIRISSFNIYNLTRDNELMMLLDYIKHMVKLINMKKCSDCVSFMCKNYY